MWSLGPRSFLNGKPYTQEEMGQLLEDRQTARSIVSTIVPRNDPALIANSFIFFEETSIESARECFLVKPQCIGEPTWHELLKSHSISEQAMINLATNKIDGFFECREESLGRQTSSFLNGMTAADFEDTPPLQSLVIDEDIEEQADDLAGEGHD